MNPFIMVAALVVTAVVAGCSDRGVDSASSSASSSSAPQAAPVPVYEYLGPVVGSWLGPVFQRDCAYGGDRNAVCFAAVTVDGVVASADVVRTGHMVHLRSTDGLNVAVEVQRAVVGAIEGVDSAAGELTVLGQRVFWLGPSETTLALDRDQLTVGTRVAVSGRIAAGGEIYATRIEAAAGDLEVVRGILADHGNGKRIGALDVDLTAARLEGFPASAPLAGDAVLLVRPHTPSGGPFVAETARYTGGVFPAPGATDWWVDGIVTAARAPTDFDVAGRRVVVGNCECSGWSAPPVVGTPAVMKSPHAPGFGSKAALRSLTSGTTILAPIEYVDAARGTLSLLGFSAQVLPSTALLVLPSTPWFDFAEAPSLITTRFVLADLRVGDWVYIDGGTDGQRYIAGSISHIPYAVAAPLLPPQMTTFLPTLDKPNLRVLGQTIATDSSTGFIHCTYYDCTPADDIEAMFTLVPPKGYFAKFDIEFASAKQPLLARAITVYDLN